MKDLIIIEDEPVSAGELARLIKAYDSRLEILVVLDTIESSVQFLQSNQPDLIFMDIELADGSAFEIFENVDVRSPVIFTTAYDEHALKAFESNGLAYLLKPITMEKIQMAFEKLDQIQVSLSDRPDYKDLFKGSGIFKENFLFKYGNSLIPVKSEDILYFYGEDTLNFVVDKNHKQYISSFNLSQLDEMLNPVEFFRISRQYIVHRDAILALTPHVKGQVSVLIDQNKKIKVIVSRQKTPLLKEWLT